MNCRWTRPALGGGLVGTLLFVAGLASAQHPPQGLPPGMNPMGPMGPTGMTPGQPAGKGDKAAADGKDDGKPKLSATWENGVWYRGTNNNFVYHIGGTVHYDAAFYQATPLLELAP